MSVRLDDYRCRICDTVREVLCFGGDWPVCCTVPMERLFGGRPTRVGDDPVRIRDDRWRGKPDAGYYQRELPPSKNITIR